MKKHILKSAMLLCSGILLMTGCNKDDQQIFHLSVNDNHAKTSLGSGYTTNWQSGDEIYINTTPLSVNVSGAQAWTSNDVNIDPVNGQFYAFYAGRCSFSGADLNAASQSYSFSMPNSYTYNPAQLQSPMAGIGTYQGSNPYTSVDVTFENLFSLLELEVPAAPAGSGYIITIFDTDSVNSVPLAGNFVATYGSDGWSTTASGNARYTLTITKNTTDTIIYVPIPAGQHKLNISANLAGFHADQTTAYSYKPGYYYKISIMPVFPTGTSVVPFPFPTDDNNYAFFGKGNLRYINPNWSLESNQWDYTAYTKTGNGNNATVNTSSQFSWMYNEDVNPLNLSNIGNNHSGYYAQGYASLLDYAHLYNWIVPSTSQWTTILGLNGTARWAYVRLTEGSNSYIGMLIAPENVTLPTGVVRGTTYSGGWTDAPTMTTSDFTTNYETQGVIFLPACGYLSYSGQQAQTNASNGYYRTSNSVGSGSEAYVLFFTATAAPNVTTTLALGNGVSTRLIFVESTNTSSTSK